VTLTSHSVAQNMENMYQRVSQNHQKTSLISWSG